MAELVKPMVVHGMYRGIELTIYGEIHDRIDQAFYESLELGEDAVWVEHSTQLCDLLPEHEVHFLDKKGLEWIWFTRTKRHLPVRCIDYRIEMGLMPKIAKDRLRQAIEQMHGEDALDMVLSVFKLLVGEFTKLDDLIQTESATWGDPISSDIKSFRKSLRAKIKAMQGPIQQVIMGELELDDIQDALLVVHHDINRLSSLVLDTRVIQDLNECTDKHVHLFVGLAHAVRLQHWLHLSVIHPIEEALSHSLLTQLDSANPKGGRKTKTRRMVKAVVRRRNKSRHIFF